MTRAMWFAAAVAAAVTLFAIFEWMAWQAGRRWYVDPMPSGHMCPGCRAEEGEWAIFEWKADHAGA